jgi:hypothetical protein
LAWGALTTLLVCVCAHNMHVFARACMVRHAMT